MAQSLVLGSVKVKKRNILGWLGLGILTFGIYVLVWYYKIQREMRDMGREYGNEELARTNPALSVLSQFVPIANLVSLHRTGMRIKATQALVNKPVDYSMGVHWVLIIVGFWPCYVQSALNGVWDHGNAILTGGRPPTAPAPEFASPMA